MYVSPEFIGSEQFQRLSGNDIKVLLFLIKHMHNTEFTCYPTFQQIEQSTVISQRTIQECLKSLRLEKLIVKIEKNSDKNKKSQFSNNIYYFSKEQLGTSTVEVLGREEEEAYWDKTEIDDLINLCDELNGGSEYVKK
ncbi:helix-turn-helix domain-containing protein [Pseudobacteroides cellulosolvens]|uniref:helix-turn-helix domain-containing protein n=1 Tax=Pseudobacteroides cellulosolvens TaxID=35825 RepID=UPI00055F4D5D|nr:helix-turn-helix domain-containing protein [Pseudobacteroides cellulosolvens]